MTEDDFSDATLILVGHGSTLNADCSADLSARRRISPTQNPRTGR
jgi:hypothetical protein